MEMIIIRVTTTRSNDTIVSVAYDMTSCQTFLDFFLLGQEVANTHMFAWQEMYNSISHDIK